MEQESRYFLNSQDLDFIVKTLNPTIKKYNRGELLCKKNSSEKNFFLILGGTVYLAVENEFEGRQILEYFVKGQILCQDMLIQPNNGSCYAIAKYPCTAALISPEKIEEYRQTHQDTALDYLPVFIWRSSVAVTQQHCHILQQKNIRNKLLTFLYCQTRRQNTFTVSLPLPYSDLADYLTVDRSALMKEISRLCSEGIIEKGSHQITLLATTPCF